LGPEELLCVHLCVRLVVARRVDEHRLSIVGRATAGHADGFGVVHPEILIRTTCIPGKGSDVHLSELVLRSVLYQKLNLQTELVTKKIT
jgi:hypothetical protein